MNVKATYHGRMIPRFRAALLKLIVLAPRRSPLRPPAICCAVLEFRWGKLKLAPTLRFTHWGADDRSHTRAN